MIKRDYQTIATVLANNLTTDNDMETVASIARNLADEFKAANPRFRYDYFFAAIGLDKWGQLKPSPSNDDREPMPFAPVPYDDDGVWGPEGSAWQQ